MAIHFTPLMMNMYVSLAGTHAEVHGWRLSLSTPLFYCNMDNLIDHYCSAVM